MRENALEIPKGVCLYRFWNLALSTPSGAEELVPLKAMLRQFRLSDRHLERHRHCTVQVCVQNDENTTAVPQRHLCRDPDGCPLISFPPADVNKIASPENGATAWSISSGQPTLGSKRYMAISHVWSDGTGIGSNTPGDVNKCLVDHFKAVAMTQEILCDGIWWDTVSLPMEKGKRVKALNKMHNNYKKAACTLVHDLELAEFTWADDGSPCVALAFSTWFSRGWTALELYVSETVWVLFKGPDGKPILKDLDKDILAHSNDPFTHPTHKQVSDVIRRLRPYSRQDMDTVSLLLEALRFRRDARRYKLV
ncbi:hypothetical protein CDV36_003676 [Fusarium kuroshium]|uniref:Heterokaryon incompatibility domain-containing protein n=1 Tax=Fusarium kuroshium TaxID=2010991 RepID=A0A3M2SGF3_9HYPO|nr:hypothetical protein CDV36_003676 [Fusarium kuroshium]